MLFRSKRKERKCDLSLKYENSKTARPLKIYPFEKSLALRCGIMIFHFSDFLQFRLHNFTTLRNTTLICLATTQLGPIAKKTKYHTNHEKKETADRKT